MSYRIAVIIALVFACAATAFAAVVEKLHGTPSNKGQRPQAGTTNALVIASINTAPAKAGASSVEAEKAPDGVWNAMKTNLLSGKVDEAARYFSTASAEEYRRTFAAMSTNEIAAVMNKDIKKSVIEEHTAQYYFEDVIGGTTITFPVEFVKEGGAWKILEF